MKDESSGSLIKYYLSDQDYLCPTLDFSQRTFYTDIQNTKENTFLTGLMMFEENRHRFDLLNTCARLNMSWMEALSNLELELFLNGVRGISRNDDQFRLLLPLRLNLTRSDMPVALKLRLRDILQAVENLYAYGKVHERIVECYVLRSLEIASGRHKTPPTSNLDAEELRLSAGERHVLNRLISIKYKRYPYLENIYPKFKKAIARIGFFDAKHVMACFFSPAPGPELPPMTLFEANQLFDKGTANGLERRFERILYKLARCRKLRSEDEFMSFALRNQFGYVSPENTLKICLNFSDTAEALEELTAYPLFLTVIAPLGIVVGDPEALGVHRQLMEMQATLGSNMTATKPQKNHYDRLVTRGLTLWGNSLIGLYCYPRKNKRQLVCREGLPIDYAKDLISCIKFTFFKYSVLECTAHLPLPVDVAEFLQGTKWRQLS